MLNSFSKEYRLIKADEFSSVFIFRKVQNGTFFKIHFKPNKLDHSRLGLVVSKRIHKRSNRRNYMKRAIRELFRLNQHNWHGHDVIVRVVKLFGREDFQNIKPEFNQLNQSLK